MTKRNYHQVSEGMTYAEVIEIVGSPHDEISSSELGGIKTVVYQWKSGLMGNATMIFQNGKLISKAQFGL